MLNGRRDPTIYKLQDTAENVLSLG